MLSMCRRCSKIVEIILKTERLAVINVDCWEAAEVVKLVESGVKRSIKKVLELLVVSNGYSFNCAACLSC